MLHVEDVRQTKIEVKTKSFGSISLYPPHQAHLVYPSAIFIGIGSHLGRARSQNAKGHLIGHVKDMGQPLDRGGNAGARYAVASWGVLAWQGAWVWRWKDVIDRRFMRRYHEAALA